VANSINISNIIKTWPVVDGWSIAPSGLSWIQKGLRVKAGNGCRLGDGCTLGNGCRLGNYCTLGDVCRLGNGCRLGDVCRLGNGCTLGDGCTNPIDLGVADGYRKCLAYVDGVPYIGAGCRWFSLDDAVAHWSNHDEDRRATQAQMRYAQELVRINKEST
jgi:NDP-sugar pyrophosphorylase family protein